MTSIGRSGTTRRFSSGRNSPLKSSNHLIRFSSTLLFFLTTKSSGAPPALPMMFSATLLLKSPRSPAVPAPPGLRILETTKDVVCCEVSLVNGGQGATLLLEPLAIVPPERPFDLAIIGPVAHFLIVHRRGPRAVHVDVGADVTT